MNESVEKEIAPPHHAIALVRDREIEYELCVPHADQDYIQHFLQSEGRPYELQMLRDMASRLSAGDLVLDVGAHVGNHTFYLANAVQARIEAFEPNTELADAMEATIEHSGLQDLVTVHAVGVGREAGTARFKAEVPDNLGAQELETGEGGIPVVTLDACAFEGTVRLLKIDVEGMELEVLEGESLLLAKDRPLLYIECRDEETFQQLPR